MPALWPRAIRLLEEIALGLLAFLHVPVPDGGGILLHAAAFVVIGYIATVLVLRLRPLPPAGRSLHRSVGHRSKRRPSNRRRQASRRRR